MDKIPPNPNKKKPRVLLTLEESLAKDEAKHRRDYWDTYDRAVQQTLTAIEAQQSVCECATHCSPYQELAMDHFVRDMKEKGYEVFMIDRDCFYVIKVKLK